MTWQTCVQTDAVWWRCVKCGQLYHGVKARLLCFMCWLDANPTPSRRPR